MPASWLPIAVFCLGTYFFELLLLRLSSRYFPLALPLMKLGCRFSAQDAPDERINFRVKKLANHHFGIIEPIGPPIAMYPQALRAEIANDGKEFVVRLNNWLLMDLLLLAGLVAYDRISIGFAAAIVAMALLFCDLQILVYLRVLKQIREGRRA